MKDRLKFDNPKTMHEVIRKACICYQQNRPKGDGGKWWSNKKGTRFVSGSKGNKIVVNKGPHKGQPNKIMNKNQPRFKILGKSKTNEQSGRTKVEIAARLPVQCWGCGGPHYLKNFPYCKGTYQVAQLQEASTVGEVASSIPKINVSLEDHQTEYQPTMVEFEGKIFDQTMSILIDTGATLSYISPKLVE